MKKIVLLLFLGGAFACSSNKYSYDAAGTFEATEVIVSAEASGRILELNLLEGDRLEAGQQVGSVDSMQLYLTKLQLEKNINATRTRSVDIPKQMAAIQQHIATQQREKQRVESLIRSDAATTKQLDDIDAAIEQLERQLSAQRSNLERGNLSLDAQSSALEVQVAQVEDQLRKCRIVSPITGTVLVKYAESGEVTTPGRALFKIANVDQMLLRVYITAGQLTQLKLGQNIAVFADFGDTQSRQYTGEVIWISGTSEFTPKTIQTRDERANLVYAIKVAVKNDGYLKMGMYADVKFTES